MSTSPFDLAKTCADFLRNVAPAPEVAVILGSGLGALGDQLENPITIPYGNLPGFPQATVVGHAGKLVLGCLPHTQCRVVALCGRSHIYEGVDIETIVHPTRALAVWGVKSAVFTNASGSLHHNMPPGSLMMLTDHINFTGKNPLTGPKDPRLGLRFVDLSNAYDRRFHEILLQASKQVSVHLYSGIYLALAGPSYETPAEIRMFSRMGADSVGMSTVCEVIAARQAQMRVAGISCITNLAAGLSVEPLDHEDVKTTANRVMQNFIALLNPSLLAIHQELSSSA